MPGDDRRGDMFDVVPAALRGAAGTFDAEAEALAGATMSLQRHLGVLGAPWGTDEVGTRFGAAYQPAAETVASNLAALAGGFERIASALIATATDYELADAPVGTPAPYPPGPTPDPTSTPTPAPAPARPRRSGQRATPRSSGAPASVRRVNRPNVSGGRRNETPPRTTVSRAAGRRVSTPRRVNGYRTAPAAPSATPTPRRTDETSRPRTRRSSHTVGRRCP